MSVPIVVTGGTGTLGSLVVQRLRAAGASVRILSRRAHSETPGVSYVAGDLLAGTGLDVALTGAEVVLHLAGGPKGDDRAAQNLVRAAEEHHIRHLVHISVIGADRMPLGYFRAKAGAEQAITSSTVPSTILRAAQFHTLILKVAQQMAKLPFIPAPRGLRAEPVDPAEVADRLVELTFGEAAGLVEDLAGPQVHTMTDLVRSYLAARGKRRAALPIRIPGAAGRAYRAGENLSVTPGTGSIGWEQFLARHLQAGPDVVQVDR